ncbi:MAG: alkaline phosphatase family protein [Gemmatimonadetes bacterium]|nr:alkaline phosphatase family protein [Gemmatimonadota bacterium]
MLAIFQFDSAALPLLEEMLDDGRLPTLAALRARGRWDTIDAKATFLQSSTYMTLCTGVDVRNHGIYSAVPWSASDQRPRFMYTYPHPPTIWERLTAAGRRSLIVDPILAWWPSTMEGVFLSGWQFEDRMVSRGLSLPGGMRRDLGRRHGRPPRLDDVYGTRQVSDLLRWRERLVAAPDRVADATLDLLGREDFDLIWLNFGCAHKAGHHFWDPLAVTEGDVSEDDQRTLRSGLTAVYEAVDAAMGRVLEALPDSADIMVFSPTGMAANVSRADLLPGMLEAVISGPGGAARTTAAQRSPIWTLRSTLPISWRQAIARTLPDRMVADLATRMYHSKDWGQTRITTVPGENKGYLRVNLKGREREGIVDPSEVDALVAQVREGLLSFTDPDGSPSIAKVEHMPEMTDEGSHVDQLPDLVVYWGDRPPDRQLTHVQSEVHGRVDRRGVGSGRSGNHVDDAWVVRVTGPSRMSELDRPLRITDIGATACGLLGADMSGLTGSPLLESP